MDKTKNTITGVDIADRLNMVICKLGMLGDFNAMAEQCRNNPAGGQYSGLNRHTPMGLHIVLMECMDELGILEYKARSMGA